VSFGVGELAAGLGSRSLQLGHSMDVMGSLRTLRRRWILTLLLLLLTLAGTAALAMRPGPYQSQSQVVLLPSKQSTKAYGNNPYLSFGGSISLAADLVRRESMDARTVRALTAQGFPSAYLVVDDPNTAGPVLDVTVTGNNKSAVEHTLYGVTAEVRAKLAGMQADIKPTDRITSLVVSVDPQPSLMISHKARPLVLVLGLGLVLTIAVPQIVDAGLVLRRSARYGGQRRSAKEDEGSSGRTNRTAAVPGGKVMDGMRGPAAHDRSFGPEPARTSSRRPGPPSGE
jgi:hypothetical protein